MGSDMLQSLHDRQAIIEVLYGYSRAMDRMDRPLALSVFHPDATLQYAHIVLPSREAFVDWVWGIHEALVRHSHQNSNVLIELDGDRAASETYVHAYLCSALDDGRIQMRSVKGRYLDRWERRAGKWAIVRREYVHEFEDVREMENLVPDDATPSRRDRSDPSYALFARDPATVVGDAVTPATTSAS
jgi:hypothetical protein